MTMRCLSVYGVALFLVIGISGCVMSPDPEEDQYLHSEGFRLRRTASAYVEKVASSERGWERAAYSLSFQWARYAIPDLIGAFLEAPNPEVQDRLRAVIYGLPGRRAVYDEVASCLSDQMRLLGSSDAKVLAASLFTRFFNKDGYRTMISWLNDPEPRVRMAAVDALCSINTPWKINAAEEVAERLADEDREVALCAAIKMQFLVHPHVAQILLDAAGKIEDPAVARTAEQSAYLIREALQWRGLPDWAKSAR